MDELQAEIADIIEKTTARAADEVIITSNIGGTIGNRTARKPDVSCLEDAFSKDGTPLFDVGGRIVIERYATTIPGLPWLDTQTYVVREVDTVSGVMKLWNPHVYQTALTNYKLGLANGFLFKLAPTRGSIGNKKRGRPKKQTPAGAGAPTSTPTSPGAGATSSTSPGEKRGRGRPKGVKNRSKEVIRAERASKAAARKGGRS